METSIQTFMDMCQWDSARFLIISDNVFGPLIYYSHLLPLIASVVLALFIYFKNPKLLAARWLAVTTFFLVVWLFSDLVLWASEKPSYIMFFWSIVNMVEPIIYAGMLFFVYALIGGKDLSFRNKLLIFILLLPTIILASTRLNLLVFDLSNCYREVIEGILPFYGYAVEILLTLWIIGFGITCLLKEKNKEEKKKIALIISGIAFFLLSFAMGNVIGSLLVNWIIGQYGLFGIPVFLGLIAYLIVRFHTFNIKLLSTQLLVAAMWLLVLGILFVRSIDNVHAIASVTLVIVFVFGILLVRSVKRIDEKVKERTKELEDEKNKTAIITENMNEGAILFDSSQKIIFLNKKAQSILALSGKDVLSEIVVKAAFSKKFNTISIEESFAKSSREKAYVIPEIDSDDSIFKLSFSSVFDNENDRAYSLIWIEDITEDKLLERRKSGFLSIAAHQMRTPLSGLKWGLDMLIAETSTSLTPDQRDLLKKSFESSVRMISLVDDMIEVEREESGRTPYSFTKVQIPDLVDEILGEIALQAKKRKIKIIFNKSENFPKILIDPEKIRAVFQNLLENALKYTPEKGTVTIDLDYKNDHVHASIKDTGIGIPEDEKRNLFTRFFRGRNAIKMETDGSGLGLFIVKNIIERHGGKIGFESHEGKGTTFYFNIPGKNL